MKKLRIATMSTVQTPIPVPNDTIAAPVDISIKIAEGLTERGHEVTYFTSKCSEEKFNFDLQKINFNSLYSSQKKYKGWGRMKTANALDQFIFLSICKEVENFDLIHVHDPAHRALFPLIESFNETPVVATVHCGFGEKWVREMYNFFQPKNLHLVAVSEDERSSCPDLNWNKVIYNGIDVNKYPFNENPDDFLFFSGRICRAKGVHKAIQVAKNIGIELKIAGSISDKKYFNEKVKPNLSEEITYLGVLTKERLKKYYKNAKATLMPINWREPFGLTYIESMACGTPSISFNKGSAQEVIKNGKNGFVVDNLKDMVQAVQNVESINRIDCRQYVESNFSKKRMIKMYEEAYYDILEIKGGQED